MSDATPPLPPTPPAAPPASSGGKADLGKRFVAVLIDGVIAGIVAAVIPAVGGIIASAYMILRDGLEFDFMNHRSIGKQIMKLHVNTVDGAPIDIMTSVRRNWMFGIGYLIPLLIFIPILGWIAIPFVGVASVVLCLIEVFLVLTDGQGRRLGDKIAKTVIAED